MPGPSRIDWKRLARDKGTVAGARGSPQVDGDRCIIGSQLAIDGETRRRGRVGNWEEGQVYPKVQGF
jgi:hypothetical protein